MKINNENQSTVVDIEATEVNEVVNAPKTFVSNAADPPAPPRHVQEYFENTVMPEIEGMTEGGVWRIKRTPATFRRIQTLKLSDAQVTNMLKDHEGRKAFGYSYLEKVYRR